jgi:hypothetical protein
MSRFFFLQKPINSNDMKEVVNAANVQKVLTKSRKTGPLNLPIDPSVRTNNKNLKYLALKPELSS